MLEPHPDRKKQQRLFLSLLIIRLEDSRIKATEVAFPTCSTRGQYTDIQHEMKMAKSCILMGLSFNIHIRVHIKQHQSITNHSSHHCAKIVTLYKNSLKKGIVSHSLGSISVYGKNIVFSKLDFVFFVL